MQETDPLTQKKAEDDMAVFFYDMAEYVKACPQAPKWMLHKLEVRLPKVDIRRFKVGGIGEDRWVIFQWLKDPMYPSNIPLPVPILVCEGEEGGYTDISEYWLNKCLAGIVSDTKLAMALILSGKVQRDLATKRKKDEQYAEAGARFAHAAGKMLGGEDARNLAGIRIQVPHGFHNSR